MVFLSICIYLLLVSFVYAPVARVVKLNLVAQRAQAADVFHGFYQALLKRIVLHAITSKCVLVYLSILAADAAKVHQVIVAGLGHVDRKLPG